MPRSIEASWRGILDANGRKLEITTEGESDRIEHLKLANWHLE